MNSALSCLLSEAKTWRFFTKKCNSRLYVLFRGKFARIPRLYSNDLSDIIGSMLKIFPASRPNCDAIIQKIKFGRKVSDNEDSYKGLHNEAQSKTELNLLGTIEVPKDLRNLESVLPESKYLSEGEDGENLPGHNQMKYRQLSAGHIKQTSVEAQRRGQLAVGSSSVEKHKRSRFKSTQFFPPNLGW